ncbi:MAG: bifunctional heptose 7-phosphate kinase/heptose 1-phosphate adenyltransferase [Terriglobia bacterium]
MRISARDRGSLLALIARFGRQRIGVAGDLVADEFLHGEISRVSREAPVLILKQREKHIVPGGGANAANNLIEFGARVELAGVVGEDEAGDALLDYFRQKGVSTRLIERCRDYTTPSKCRVLGGISHGHPQQIVRVDREPMKPLDRPARRRLSLRLVPRLSRCSALLISDYGYGAIDAREARHLQRLCRKAPVTVDSRYSILGYNQLTAATPNEPEIEAAFGERVDNSIESLNRLALRMLRMLSLQALVVTRGREGMALYEREKKPRSLPIFGTDQVADVTGAGDTVIAAFTLALAAGASFLDAAMLANCAGGLVVMKSGTATVTAEELAGAIRNA